MTKIKSLLMSLIVALSVVFVLPTKQTEAFNITKEMYQRGDNIYLVYNEDFQIAVTDIFVVFGYIEQSDNYVIIEFAYDITFSTSGYRDYTEHISETHGGDFKPVMDMIYLGINLYFGTGQSTWYVDLIQTTTTREQYQAVTETSIVAPTQDYGQPFDMFEDYSITTKFENTFLWYQQELTYDDGYYEGMKNSEQIADDYYADGLQTGYTSGYTDGYADAEGLFRDPQNYGFLGLFTGIADTPYLILTSLLSFDVFGMSAFSILFGILTILIIAWLIKKFMV